MHTFAIAAPGTPGATVEYLLRRYGVQMGGGWSPTGGRWAEEDGTISFAVRESQARWAEYVLRKAGYAILEGATGESEVEADGSLPTPWGEGVGAGDVVGRLVDALDGALVGGANRKAANAMIQRRAAPGPAGEAGGGLWGMFRGLW